MHVKAGCLHLLAVTACFRGTTASPLLGACAPGSDFACRTLRGGGLNGRGLDEIELAAHGDPLMSLLATGDDAQPARERLPFSKVPIRMKLRAATTGGKTRPREVLEPTVEDLFFNIKGDGRKKYQSRSKRQAGREKLSAFGDLPTPVEESAGAVGRVAGLASNRMNYRLSRAASSGKSEFSVAKLQERDESVSGIRTGLSPAEFQSSRKTFSHQNSEEIRMFNTERVDCPSGAAACDSKDKKIISTEDVDGGNVGTAGIAVSNGKRREGNHVASSMEEQEEQQVLQRVALRAGTYTSLISFQLYCFGLASMSRACRPVDCPWPYLFGPIVRHVAQPFGRWQSNSLGEYTSRTW